MKPQSRYNNEQLQRNNAGDQFTWLDTPWSLLPSSQHLYFAMLGLLIYGIGATAFWGLACWWIYRGPLQRDV